MALLQIYEPGQTPSPHDGDNEMAVGIDLGTTNSLVCLATNGVASIIQDKNGNKSQPSIVQFLTNGDVNTGRVDENQNGETIRSVKRLMGRSVKDIKATSGQIPYKISDNYDSGIVRLDVNGKALTPVEISAQILRSLKSIAQDALSGTVTKAVITVPAYFDDAARSATKDAASLAGLEVLRLINEPTAAALAYGLDQQPEGIYAVYDLGGGTFDITVLKMEKGIFQVLSTGGSTEIGGDDFDREIAELCLWKHKKANNKATKLSHIALQKILNKSRIAKEYLSDHDSGNFEFEIEGKTFDTSISRKEFERAIMPYIDATIDICGKTIEDAGVNNGDINGIILVGGSTRIPLVRQRIQEAFSQKLLQNLNPDEVVAHGAALQAEGLTKGSDNLLLDVLPLSLGIETMGGIIEKIITRNTPIPVAKAQEFTTYQNGQTGLQIHVVQGEREMASQNRSLAYFELKGIPPMVAGAARIKVTFAVDADGLLTVTAQEETHKVEQQVVVKPSYGLTDAEIKEMLYASMQHAKDDMEVRLLTESKIEAQGVIMSIEAAMRDDIELLGEDDIQNIEQIISRLKNAIDGSDRQAISELREDLESAVEGFASLRMDKHIGNALKGCDIDDIN